MNNPNYNINICLYILHNEFTINLNLIYYNLNLNNLNIMFK